MRFLVALALGLAAALLPGATAPSPARADDATESRYHDGRARRFFRQGRYEDALHEFFEVQRIAPSNLTLFNIGACFIALNDAQQAFLALTEYLEGLAPDDPDDGRREVAEGQLQRIGPEVARVRVTSRPAGATIFVDAEEYGAFGTTPRLIAVDPGERRILVEREGYRPASTTVEAVLGQEAQVTLELEQVVGQVRLLSEPPGAQLEVRDAAGEVRAEGAAPLAAALPPGPYTVGASLAGHQPGEALVTVRADEALERTLPLTPLPEPTGRVTVSSNVRRATVALDGEVLGFAPLILPEVAAGTRTLRLEAPDVAPWEGEIAVDPDTPVWATVVLEPPSRQRHSLATWILGGTGLAALGAGLGFAIHYESLRDEFRTLQGMATVEDDARLRQLRSDGDTYGALADGFLIGGAVLLGISVVLFIVEELRPQRTSRATVESTPQALP
ncbi:MAG: PEGA domain-containing protein [Sandaracinaceae bacterium]